MAAPATRRWAAGSIRASKRHWRSYGTEPCLRARKRWASLGAFPSWFLRIECDRCGKVQLINQAHMQRGEMPIRDLLRRMRHDGCGGRAGNRRLHAVASRDRRAQPVAVFKPPPNQLSCGHVTWPSA